MTEIPLDHVNRDAGVEQAGGRGYLYSILKNAW